MWAKIAVVTVQPMVAPCRSAMASPMPNTVVSLWCGTPRMASSTSRGEGMAMVPAPRRLAIAAGIGLTCGNLG